MRVELLILLITSYFIPKDILTTENSQTDSVFGKQTTLNLKDDFTYSYKVKFNDASYGKSKEIKGHFQIKSDTIYFSDSSSFKKGIINGNYLELVEPHYKIKIVTNKTSLRAKYSVPKDFTVFTYSKSFEDIFKSDGKGFNPTESEFTLIQKQLNLEIKKKIKLFYKHKNQSEYYKQCVFMLNKNGEKEVWLQGISKKEKSFKDNWQYEMQYVNDGGEYFFELKMNLSTGKVDYFYVHGVA